MTSVLRVPAYHLTSMLSCPHIHHQSYIWLMIVRSCMQGYALIGRSCMSHIFKCMTLYTRLGIYVMQISHICMHLIPGPLWLICSYSYSYLAHVANTQCTLSLDSHKTVGMLLLGQEAGPRAWISSPLKIQSTIWLASSTGPPCYHMTACIM